MTRALPLLLLLAAAACSVTEIGAAAAARRARAAGYVEGTLDDGQRVVRYWRDPTGEPVLLLHGFGGDGLFNWSAQLGPLGERFGVITPDLLWFGQSHGGGPPGLEAQADAMAALLDHLGVPRAHVVGVSYGGFVTLKLLQRHPHRVGKVVLVDSPGPVFTAEEEAALYARLGVTRAADVFVPATTAQVKTLIDLTWYRDRPVPEWVLADLLENVFQGRETERRALLDDLVAHRGTTPSAWDTAAHPSLVVWGEHDEVFPLAAGRRLAETVGAELVVIPETSHGPLVEDADTFNAAVIEFLGRR